MKSKAMIPMLVGVGIGLLTLKMGWNYIEKSRLSAVASQGDTPVVVASRSVSPGTPIQLADLETVQWPRSAVPSQAFADPQKLVGRVNQAPLSAELPVLESMLTPPGTTPGLPALIPPGYQAMAVKVDEFRGVGGFLKPGDKVDVVATFNVKQAKSGPTKTVTRTILRDIKVSTVGEAIEPGEDNQPMIVRSVTLLVTPRQAQWLSMASTRGTIRLSLRSGRGADSTSTLSAITFEELLSGKAEKETSSEHSKSLSGWIKSLLKPKKASPQPVVSAPVKVDPRWQMQIFRGLTTEEIVFENASSARRIEPGSVPQNSQKLPQPQKYQELRKQDKTKVLEYLENEFFGEQEATE